MKNNQSNTVTLCDFPGSIQKSELVPFTLDVMIYSDDRDAIKWTKWTPNGTNTTEYRVKLSSNKQNQKRSEHLTPTARLLSLAFYFQLIFLQRLESLFQSLSCAWKSTPLRDSRAVKQWLTMCRSVQREQSEQQKRTVAPETQTSLSRHGPLLSCPVWSSLFSVPALLLSTRTKRISLTPDRTSVAGSAAHAESRYSLNVRKSTPQQASNVVWQ